MNNTISVAFNKKQQPKPRRFIVRLSQPEVSNIRISPSQESILEKFIFLKEVIEPKYSETLLDALDNLSIALSSELREESKTELQTNTLEKIEQALALHKEFYSDTEPYSWFAYYAEKNIAENITANLFQLKQMFGSEWADTMRSEVRMVAFAYANYLDLCKKELEKKLISKFRKTLSHPDTF